MSSTLSNKYLRKIRNLEDLEKDREAYHVDRDLIYEDFIRDVANGKMTKAQSQAIAEDIVKGVFEKQIGVWYA